jgi:hypothetical protein
MGRTHLWAGAAAAAVAGLAVDGAAAAGLDPAVAEVASLVDMPICAGAGTARMFESACALGLPMPGPILSRVELGSWPDAGGARASAAGVIPTPGALSLGVVGALCLAWRGRRASAS